MALGIFVGVLLGLTGAGGAILSVPLLGFFLHLTVAEAAPIGLLAVSLSAGLGAYLGLRSKIMRYKAAMLIASAGLLFSPIGIWLAHQLPNWPLVLIFCLVLLLVARNMWIQAKRALAGFFSGLLGVGGGFIIVPALRKFTDLPMKSIVATSLGVLTIVSFGGVLFSNLYGSMNWSLVIPFACDSVVGLLIGCQAVKSISGPRAQQAFAVFALMISVAMMIKLVVT